MKRHSGLAALISCLCIVGVSCNKANAPSKSLTVAQLKINDGDISGWTIDKWGNYYTPEAWKDGMSIDGEAFHYTVDPGLTFSEVLDERMQRSSSGSSLTLYLIDYASDKDASVMYDYTKTHGAYPSNKESLAPQYAETVAVGENSHDGIAVCARFKQYYIEMRFTGYTDFLLSKQDAIQFLGLLESNINGD